MKSAEFMRLGLRFVTDNLRSHVGSAPFFLMMFVLIYLFSFLFCVFCIVYRHSVSCSEGCLCLWTVHFWLPIRFSLTFLYKYIHVLLSFYKNNLLIKNKLHQLLVSLKTIFSHPMHDLPLFEVAIRPYVHSFIVVPPFVYKKMK